MGNRSLQSRNFKLVNWSFWHEPCTGAIEHKQPNGPEGLQPVNDYVPVENISGPGEATVRIDVVISR